MNTKICTSIEQSELLAEILPIKSADMHYIIIGTKEEPKHIVGFGKYIGILPSIPCWSLAALLNYIKDKCDYFDLVYLSSAYVGYKRENVYRLSTDLYDVNENELIDACYKMIIKLHGQNVL